MLFNESREPCASPHPMQVPTLCKSPSCAHPILYKSPPCARFTLCKSPPCASPHLVRGPPCASPHLVQGPPCASPHPVQVPTLCKVHPLHIPILCKSPPCARSTLYKYPPCASQNVCQSVVRHTVLVIINPFQSSNVVYSKAWQLHLVKQNALWIISINSIQIGSESVIKKSWVTWVYWFCLCTWSWIHCGFWMNNFQHMELWTSITIKDIIVVEYLYICQVELRVEWV